MSDQAYSDQSLFQLVSTRPGDRSLEMADAEKNDEDLAQEVDGLKRKLEDERCRLNDGNLVVISHNVDPIPTVNARVRRVLKGHQGKVLSLAWGTDKRHIVSSSQDGKILVWDAFTMNKEFVISMPTTWVMACAYSPSGNYVACGGLDNKCTVYPLTPEEDPVLKKKLVATHMSYLACCQFNISDHQLLTGSGDSTCVLWDIESAQIIQSFHGHSGDVLSISLSPSESGRVFVSAVPALGLTVLLALHHTQLQPLHVRVQLQP